MNESGLERKVPWVGKKDRWFFFKKKIKIKMENGTIVT